MPPWFRVPVQWFVQHGARSLHPFEMIRDQFICKLNVRVMHCVKVTLDVSLDSVWLRRLIPFSKTKSQIGVQTNYCSRNGFDLLEFTRRSILILNIVAEENNSCFQSLFSSWFCIFPSHYCHQYPYCYLCSTLPLLAFKLAPRDHILVVPSSCIDKALGFLLGFADCCRIMFSKPFCQSAHGCSMECAQAQCLWGLIS